MRSRADHQHVSVAPLDIDKVVERPGELTAAWLTAATGAATVADFTVERIGTGQMSECYRIGLTYADRCRGRNGPDSVVLKVAATDAVSRQTGVALGLYDREVCFYRDIAPRLRGPVAPWLRRDAPIDQALITQLYASFVDRYGERITPQQREVCERLVGGFDAYLAAGTLDTGDTRIHGLVHGDYRLDNMLFGAADADRPLTVVDWQTVRWGPAMTDLAYFLGCALSAADRRTHYDELLRDYHAALGPESPISFAEVREGVRRQSFFGVMMAIVSAMLVERTERGDAMFMTMLQRHVDHVLDTDALATMAAPTSVESLRPARDDESAHSATGEPLWSESWYADFMGYGQHRRRPQRRGLVRVEPQPFTAVTGTRVR
jgi:hypothetical protein